MRVLFLLADLRHTGGITQYNVKLIQTFRELGAEVSLVERGRGGLFAKAAFVMRFFSRIVFRRPEVIVCTNLNFSPLAMWAHSLFGIPYSVTVYGIEVANIRRDDFKRALRSARVIVKLFDQAERDVVRQIPEVAWKFVRVPNAVDGERFTIQPRPLDLLGRYGFDPENKIAFTIARISKEDGENKGYERVIRAMPAILKEVPEARYLLGGGGDDLERMKTLVQDLGLEGKVVFAGRIPDEELVAHYNAADLFVMPSKHEGFPPIVFLEALACGVPVVGGAQPDAEASLWKDELARIVPPDDVAAIGQAIAEVLSGKAPQRFYEKERLRRRVLEEYGLDRYREYARALLHALEIRN